MPPPGASGSAYVYAVPATSGGSACAADQPGYELAANQDKGYLDVRSGPAAYELASGTVAVVPPGEVAAQPDVDTAARKRAAKKAALLQHGYTNLPGGTQAHTGPAMGPTPVGDPTSPSTAAATASHDAPTSSPPRLMPASAEVAAVAADKAARKKAAKKAALLQHGYKNLPGGASGAVATSASSPSTAPASPAGICRYNNRVVRAEKE